MTPLLLAAVVAVGAQVGAQEARADAPIILGQPATPDSGQVFLAIEFAGGSGVAYTVVYDTYAAAVADGLRASLCGFWRLDLISQERVLVGQGGVRQVRFMEPMGPPPDGPQIPPPDVDQIIDCPAARTTTAKR